MRSFVIRDHTVLPATRHRWFSRLYPSVLPVLIYRPRKAELAWAPWVNSWLRTVMRCYHMIDV